MQATISITGSQPIIHHSAAGLDTRTPIALEKQAISAKKGSNRTVTDEFRLRELEALESLWLSPVTGEITIPPEAVRSCLETAARKLKQGPAVREGLVVDNTAFKYDREALGNTPEEVAQSAQFTVPVVVPSSRGRIMRTRVKFDQWGLTFDLDFDPELIDQLKLETWLDIAGRRIGLGDWRPEKGGRYGRFTMESIVIAE